MEARWEKKKIKAERERQTITRSSCTCKCVIQESSRPWRGSRSPLSTIRSTLSPIQVFSSCWQRSGELVWLLFAEWNPGQTVIPTLTLWQLLRDNSTSTWRAVVVTESLRAGRSITTQSWFNVIFFFNSKNLDLVPPLAPGSCGTCKSLVSAEPNVDPAITSVTIQRESQSSSSMSGRDGH